MKSHAAPFSRKWRQFRFLSKKLNRLLENGKFDLLSKSRQRKLLNRLKELYTVLKQVVSSSQLKKTLAGASFLLGLGFSNAAAAQTFAPLVIDPFGIINIDDFSVPNMVDIDDDGDLDMFISTYSFTDYEYDIKFMENTGSSDSPDFTGQQAVSMPFGIQMQNINPESVILLDFADMDNDGDQDLLVGGTDLNSYGTVLYFENTGSVSQASFGTPLSNPFGFQATYFNAFPDLVDIDSDGDFDLMVGEYYASIQYFENVGTPEAPMFASPVSNPFGISQPSLTYYSIFDIADIDGDGDQDLVKTAIQEYFSSFLYQENIGSPTVPNFAAPTNNPFAFDELGVAMPHLADIDMDGDIDVFFGNANSVAGGFMTEILFYENTSSVSTNDLLKETTLKFGPNPTSGFISLQSELNAQNGKIDLRLMNVAGQVFQRQNIQAIGNQISWEANIRHLPVGSYLLRLDADGHFGVIPFEKI